MRILFLDDDVSRHETFKRQSIGHYVSYVYDAVHAIKEMDTGDFDLIYLDHDLGGEISQNRLDCPEDGRYIALWISEHTEKFTGRNTRFVIHSLNHAGAEGMMWSLRDVGLPVYVRPFAWKITPEALEI